MKIASDIIPAQKTGGHTEATAKLEMRSRHTALGLYKDAYARLLDINNWTHLCGDSGAEFKLTDSDGTILQKNAPLVGNLIRIKLPAPPNKAGDGFDWVRIESFEKSKDLIKDEELSGFRVRPVKNPAHNTGDSAHFYTSEASSTFLIMRNSSTVYALERGRNEVINSSGSLLNKLRNRLVAISAKIGFSKPQWKILMEGILKPPALK